jgi:hypothetical protein
MGLERISAAAYLRSALSKNCCWMRCSSMGHGSYDRGRHGRFLRGNTGCGQPQPCGRDHPASNAA